jgi:hypothetical protein
MGFGLVPEAFWTVFEKRKSLIHPGPDDDDDDDDDDNDRSINNLICFTT